jgi:hypothetical protein
MQTQKPVIVLDRSLALVNAISEALQFYKQKGNSYSIDRVDQRARAALLETFLPRGSGIDSGTKIDLDKSEPNKIVLTFDYHHMDEHGYYDGWSCGWKAIITPTFQCFSGIDIQIKSGKFNSRSHSRRYNDDNFKDYLYETYYYVLGLPIVHAYDQTNCEVVYFSLDEAKRKFPDSNIWKP